VKGLDSRFWRGEGLDVLFAEAFQGTVPQFAEFAIQEMFATQKGQQGIAALLHSTSSMYQSLIVTEQRQSSVQCIQSLSTPPS
jgi:hypothetical protein